MTNWQQQVAVFARRHNLLRDPTTHTLDLMSEVGEIAKEILLTTDYGQQPPQFRPELAGELGDALYSLLTLASACDVDVEEAIDATLAKYERRLAQRGDAGSQ
jgi:NTP pyrophosphatase (non-canonical NTP hydrolase)